MTTIDTHAAGAAGGVTASTSGGMSSVADWLTTTDHKRIGRLFISVSLVALLGVVVIAVLLGIERIDGEAAMLDVNSIPQLFALYRVGLTFVVLVPLLLGIAIAVVPLQLGTRSLTFPRLAASGFWAWCIGAVLVVISIAANGGPGGGNSKFVGLFLVSHIVLLLGLVAAAASLATTILTTRAPGMNMRRVPAFSWSALISALGLLLVLPAVIGALIFTYVDYRNGRIGFGGNQAINDWIGFGFTQPATFVYAVPVFGFAAEVIAVASGRKLPMRGVIFTGLGLVGITAALGAVTQQPADLSRNISHMSLGSWLSDVVPYALFNLLPVLGGFIVIALGALALRGGRPRLIAPLVFGLLGALMVFVGIVANVVYHVGDAQLGGTVFEEGVWLYIVYGAILSALGAITYWGPKLWGRLIPDKQVLPLAALGFIATVLASLPYLIAGFAKQPANASEFDYDGPQNLWNGLAAAGHLLMFVTVLGFVGLAARSFTRGTAASDDPWDGQTLEWATSSPAPYANFADVHIVASPEPLLDLKPRRDR
ncbi:MAG TPA: cbb3-type cytochrome c oxidase subunit I [Ilumatobacteraceae bacterium]|nr:cbb3-type cytochrome c oxidase subunit I [Ilumatobacteraceae bacterium]